MPTTFQLRDLGLSAGQARQEQLELELVPYRQAGGIEYAVRGGRTEARLDISAMTAGNSFRLRFVADYEGPCARCLEQAIVHAQVDSWEVHDPAADDEQLQSDHVDDRLHQLDLTSWAQEAVGLDFPTRVLCRPDCRGLCPVCGVNLNEAPEGHRHEEVSDSRWDKLRELQLENE